LGGYAMAAGAASQVWLNRQADRIERTLSALELPVRVSGGQVREGRVRYHLTPVGATKAECLVEAEQRVATALGAGRVRVAREIDELALDVMGEPESELRLLPLMHAVGSLPPLTALLGMSAEGHPCTLSLEDAATRHLLIEGSAGSGKSELMRSLMLSLALTSRPSQLQMMALDSSGRELTCLEALPHALTDMAVGGEFALELIDWLTEEAERRREHRSPRPALVLFVDAIEEFENTIQNALIRLTGQIRSAAADGGVRLVIAGRELNGFAKFRGMAQARALAERGAFRFQAADREFDVEVAWMPVQDLDTAVSLARQHPGAVDRGALTAVLSGAS
ncbi:MAG: FtsK/SpoIIIE domain-containing protein, partial [Anaerolineales bacterium]